MVRSLLIAILLTALGSAQAATTRIKDIAVIKNVRPNQLVGYGLVVGLNGTGTVFARLRSRVSPFSPCWTAWE